MTGFEQEYNQEPPPAQELNPDAVTEDSVLPPKRAAATARKGVRKGSRKGPRK